MKLEIYGTEIETLGMKIMWMELKFLAVAKQLYECFSPSVHLFVSYNQGMGGYLLCGLYWGYALSPISVKFQGHTAKKLSNLTQTGRFWTVTPVSIHQCITMAMPWAVIQVCSTRICMVQCTHLITTGGTPHLYNRGSSMLVNSLHSGENM